MKISIIGAGGGIGSEAAFNIAIHDIADELVMIDNFSLDRLEQYETDLKAAVTGLDILVRAGKDEDLSGSDIVIIAAGSANVKVSRSEVLPQNLPIIKGFADNIMKYCPGAVVITITNPVDPLNYAMYRLTGMDRKKLLGYSTNDSIRFRMFLSQALNIKSSEIQAAVLGEHGASQTLLFSSVEVNGRPYSVSQSAQQQVRQSINNLPNVLEPQRMKTGRTSPWTTSMGLTNICKSISRNEGRIIPCSVVLEGEYRCKDMSMSVPVKLGSQGVVSIQELTINEEEQEYLDRSIKILQGQMQIVDEFVQKNT